MKPDNLEKIERLQDLLRLAEHCKLDLPLLHKPSTLHALIDVFYIQNPDLQPIAEDNMYTALMETFKAQVKDAIEGIINPEHYGLRGANIEAKAPLNAIGPLYQGTSK